MIDPRKLDGRGWREPAKIFGLSVRSCQRLAKKIRLPIVTTGRKGSPVRWSRAELVAYYNNYVRQVWEKPKE